MAKQLYDSYMTKQLHDCYMTKQLYDRDFLKKANSAPGIFKDQSKQFMTALRNFKDQSQRFTIFGIMYRYKNAAML